MVEKMLEYANLSPEQILILSKTTKNLKQKFFDLKNFKKDKFNFQGKHLMSKQIYAEHQRRREENVNFYIEEIEELKENIQKKQSFVKQFEKKFFEVEIFVQRESKITEMDIYEKFNDYEILAFIYNNEVLHYRKMMLGDEVKNIIKDEVIIRDENNNLKIRDKSEINDDEGITKRNDYKKVLNSYNKRVKYLERKNHYLKAVYEKLSMKILNFNSNEFGNLILNHRNNLINIQDNCDVERKRMNSVAFNYFLSSIKKNVYETDNNYLSQKNQKNSEFDIENDLLRFKYSSKKTKKNRKYTVDSENKYDFSKKKNSRNNSRKEDQEITVNNIINNNSSTNRTFNTEFNKFKLNLNELIMNKKKIFTESQKSVYSLEDKNNSKSNSKKNIKTLSYKDQIIVKSTIFKNNPIDIKPIKKNQELLIDNQDLFSTDNNNNFKENNLLEKNEKIPNQFENPQKIIEENNTEIIVKLETENFNSEKSSNENKEIGEVGDKNIENTENEYDEEENNLKNKKISRKSKTMEKNDRYEDLFEDHNLSFKNYSNYEHSQLGNHSHTNSDLNSHFNLSSIEDNYNSKNTKHPKRKSFNSNISNFESNEEKKYNSEGSFNYKQSHQFSSVFSSKAENKDIWNLSCIDPQNDQN